MKYLETPIDECQDETVPKDWKSTGGHGDQVRDDIENIEEKSIGKLVLAVESLIWNYTDHWTRVSPALF